MSDEVYVEIHFKTPEGGCVVYSRTVPDSERAREAWDQLLNHDTEGEDLGQARPLGRVCRRFHA